MTDRVLDLSETGAFLRVEYEQLKIERDGAAVASVPLVDVGVLVVGHPQVACTQAVLAGIVGAGGTVVVCDRNRLPVGMLLPLVRHGTQTERFARQAAASLPRKKRAWQQIVRAKLAAQAALLEALRGDEAGLRALIPRVVSGDRTNIESRAAQRYWPLLFDDPSFRRSREAPDQNRMLNYGYAVLRATTARAICAAGLHPSLGIHHHNRYDAFCLADDLMEPYRPIVDAAVVECASAFGGEAPLSPAVKQALLEPLLGRFRCGEECRTLDDWLRQAANALAGYLLGESDRLKLPTDLQRAEASDAPE